MSPHKATSLAAAMLAAQAARQTGAFNVQAHGVRTLIYFFEGSVVSAEQGVPEDALGRLLLREGKLTSEQHIVAIEHTLQRPSRAARLRFGELLVELGLLDAKEVRLALAAQVRQKTVRCLAQADAQWTFEQGAERMRSNEHFPTTVGPLILEAAKLIPAERLDRVLELGDKRYPRLTAEPSAVARQLELNDTQESWVASIDGFQSVHQLVRGAQVERAEVLLFALVHSQLVELYGDPRGAPREPAGSMDAGVRGTAIGAMALKKAPFVAPPAEPSARGAGREANEPRTLRTAAEEAFRKGNHHLAQDEPVAAAVAFRRAVALQPDVARFVMFLDWAEVLSSPEGEARSVREASLKQRAHQATKQDPSFAAGFFVLGSMAALDGLERHAVRFLQSALELDPTLAEAERQLKRLGVAAPGSTVAPEPKQEAAKPKQETPEPEQEAAKPKQETPEPEQEAAKPKQETPEPKDDAPRLAAAASSTTVVVAPPHPEAPTVSWSAPTQALPASPARQEAPGARLDSSAGASRDERANSEVLTIKPLEGSRPDRNAGPSARGDAAASAATASRTAASAATASRAAASAAATSHRAAGAAAASRVVARATAPGTASAVSSAAAASATGGAPEPRPRVRSRGPLLGLIAALALTVGVAIGVFAFTRRAAAPAEPSGPLASIQEPGSTVPTDFASRDSSSDATSESEIDAAADVASLEGSGSDSSADSGGISPVLAAAGALRIAAQAQAPSGIGAQPAAPNALQARSRASAGEMAAPGEGANSADNGSTLSDKTAHASPSPDLASGETAPSQPPSGTIGEAPSTGDQGDGGTRVAKSTGLLVTLGGSGHRIFVDGVVVGETPTPVRVTCGEHVIRVGSAGREQTIVVPCGGSVTVAP